MSCLQDSGAMSTVTKLLFSFRPELTWRAGNMLDENMNIYCYIFMCMHMSQLSYMYLGSQLIITLISD